MSQAADLEVPINALIEVAAPPADDRRNETAITARKRLQKRNSFIAHKGNRTDNAYPICIFNIVRT